MHQLLPIGHGILEMEAVTKRRHSADHTAAVVLIQSSKGGGLAAGLSSSNQVMGVRKTTEGLEKLTWRFGAGLMILVLLATLSLPSASRSGTTSTPIEKQSTTLERASKTNVPQSGLGNQQQQQHQQQQQLQQQQL